MELLTPSHPPGPMVDRYSGLSFPTSSHAAGLVELSSSRSRTSNSSSAEREGGCDRLYLAVGRSIVKTQALLRWAHLHFSSSELFLVHVHQPSPLIPTLLGKLPAIQANPVVVANHRKEEWEKTNKLLNRYLKICLLSKVQARIITIEAEHVVTGLMDLIVQHQVKKLVMGALPENCFRGRRSFSLAKYAAKNAPLFCEIMFVHRGKHVWTREALETVSLSSASCPSSASDAESLRTESLICSEECLYSDTSADMNEIKDCIGNAQVKTGEQMSVCKVSGKGDSYCVPDAWSLNMSPGCSSSSRIQISSDSDFEIERKRLCVQLEVANKQAENLKHETQLSFLERRELEADAMQAMCEMKDFEAAYASEIELRKIAEDTHRAISHEGERLLEERLKVTREIQKTRTNVAILSSRVQEAEHRCNEASQELTFIQGSMGSLRKEKKNLQRQTIEADSWLERWRSNREASGTNRNGNSWFLVEMPGLVEFSPLDLETATCNYSNSFRLGEGGFGCVYKGELLDKTVAIKQLYAHNTQGPSLFQKEVQLLGRVRHPHLVTLIGACVEVWSLVYDYLPNGSLENRLFHKSNCVVPLSWKDRTRIISEISCALQFLHTSYPGKIVHGDLKPENILLDSELRCKISDFGIGRLLTEETLRCPSFRHYTEPKGALPYTDPEFQRTGILTPKSDLYSFGVVILQIVTGRHPVGLVGEVRKSVSHGKLASVLDPTAGDWPMSVAGKLVNVGLDFCKLNSQDRPSLTPSVVMDLQKLHTSEDRPVPSFFKCPISHEIMHDPVVAADGHTYDRENLYEWWENGRETSPMTNLPLEHLQLTPNHALRRAIQDWLCKC